MCWRKRAWPLWLGGAVSAASAPRHRHRSPRNEPVARRKGWTEEGVGLRVEGKTLWWHKLSTRTCISARVTETPQVSRWAALINGDSCGLYSFTPYVHLALMQSDVNAAVMFEENTRGARKHFAASDCLSQHIRISCRLAGGRRQICRRFCKYLQRSRPSLTGNHLFVSSSPSCFSGPQNLRREKGN